MLVHILKPLILVTKYLTGKVEVPRKHPWQCQRFIFNSNLSICNVCSSVSISLLTLGYDVCELVGCDLLIAPLLQFKSQTVSTVKTMMFQWLSPHFSNRNTISRRSSQTDFPLCLYS